MGNLCPYWDGSLPILGADAGFAGNQRKLYGGSVTKYGGSLGILRSKGLSVMWSRQSWRRSAQT
jgi:hypothetical protein